MNQPEQPDILLQIAMRVEAMPIIEQWSLTAHGKIDSALPAELWRGRAHGRQIALVIHGCDATYHCDQIGTETATIVAFLALRCTRAKLLLNAGTCGGFQSQGAHIGDAYMPTRFFFHDQRVDLDLFRAFGIGDRSIADRPSARHAAQAKIGTCSTGSSLDVTASELALFARESVTCKDMEAAAIVRVAHDLDTPFVAVKVVTDLVDHPEPVATAFVRNLAVARARLAVAIDAVVAAL